MQTLVTRKKLSPEVCDYVIDFVHDDRQTLKNCSLVCSAWVPAASYHLFSTLVVVPLLLIRLYPDPNEYPDYFKCKSVKRITENVRNVRLSGVAPPEVMKNINAYRRKTRRQLAKNPPDVLYRMTTSLHLNIVGDILATFPKMRSLQCWMEHTPLSSAPDPLLAHLDFTRPTDVKLDQVDLSFSKTTFRKTSLADFLNLSKEISTFRFQSVDGLTADYLKADMHPALTVIRTLDITMFSNTLAAMLLEVLPRAVDLTFVKSLRLAPYSHDQSRNAPVVDAILGKTTLLEKLTIEFCPPTLNVRWDFASQAAGKAEDVPFPEALNWKSLEFCTTLKTVHIHVPLYYAKKPHGGMSIGMSFKSRCIWQDWFFFSQIIDILRKAPPSLTHLRLTLHEYDQSRHPLWHDGTPEPALEALQELNWQKFSQRVERLKKLEVLEIELSCHVHLKREVEEEAKNFVRSALSQSVRQLLHFHTPSNDRVSR